MRTVGGSDVSVSAKSLESAAADIFLLNCPDKPRGCFVATQHCLHNQRETLVVDDPKEGDWRIVIRTRETTNQTTSYQVEESFLMPSTRPTQRSDNTYTSGETWSLPVPAKQSDEQYTGFRIAGTRRNESQKDGLLIAVTPLNANATRGGTKPIGYARSGCPSRK